jgi:hypothetical protein
LRRRQEAGETEPNVVPILPYEHLQVTVSQPGPHRQCRCTPRYTPYNPSDAGSRRRLLGSCRIFSWRTGQPVEILNPRGYDGLEQLISSMPASWHGPSSASNREDDFTGDH